MTSENTSPESVASSGAAASSDTTTTPSASPATAPAQSAPAVAASTSAPLPGAEGQPVVPPAFQPNFKFKAFGKEHEIEETFRSLIKDKDTEEKVRKFHEKAYAMEKFQEDSKKFKGDFESYKTQVEPNLQALNHFNTLLKNKDWDNFFSGLRVPEDEIFNWVQKRLELKNMDPAQRAEFDRASQARQQNYMYEQQVQQHEQRYQALATETRSMQLDSMMSRQDVSAEASRIDQAYGRIGAFRDLVIEEAANYWHRTQQDIPAEQAVQMTLQKYGKLLGPASAVASPAGQPSSPQAAAAPTGNAAPIIPHVPGSGKSPVKKQIRSLDDVRALAKSMTS